MHMAILGPGGVGGFLAAALARAGQDVTVVGRPESVAVIERDGIAVRSRALGDFTSRVRAVAELRTAVDVLFVATKATALADALTRIAVVPGLVVPLLNGLDHMALLRERMGPDRVVAATIRIEAERVSAGQIRQNSPGVTLHLAAQDPALRARLDPVARVLGEAGLSVHVSCGEAHILWSKLVRLNALALTTSAADRPLGEIRRDPHWRAELHGAIAETAAVAVADGGSISLADTEQELERAHPDLVSSMARDITAGRPTELDAIAGAVLRAGRRHGLECPTVARLAAQVAARSGEPVPA